MKDFPAPNLELGKFFRLGIIHTYINLSEPLCLCGV